MNSKKNKIVILILILLLYFPFFYFLAHQPIRLFDETRIAFNDYEMLHGNNWIVKTFDHKPDMWDVKPPFLNWCQSFLMKIIGPWELALRLPSAIAGFMTALMVFVFAWKFFKRFWLGIISALVLVTVKGYIDFHGVRTCDYDSMVTFFVTLYTLLFFIYYETGRIKYLHFGMAALTFAVMTKGIAGILFMPSIAIAALFYGKVKSTLSNKNFYFSLFGFIIVVGGYYFLREFYTPGYLKKVGEEEIWGRYLETIENHKEPFWFYFSNIINWHMPYWVLLIPIGFIAGIIDRENRFRRFIWFISLVAISYLLIISGSETKLSWYIYQIIPVLSLLTATFLYYIFNQIEKLEISGIIRRKILPYAFLCFVIYTPYREIFLKVYLGNETDWEAPIYRIGYYLSNLSKGKSELKEPLNIVYSGIQAHLKYYSDILNSDGYRIQFKEKENLQKGDLVICSQDEIDQYICNNYSLVEIRHHDNLFIYKVISRKNL